MLLDLFLVCFLFKFSVCSVWWTKLATCQFFYCTLNTQYRIISYHITQSLLYTVFDGFPHRSRLCVGPHIALLLHAQELRVSVENVRCRSRLYGLHQLLYPDAKSSTVRCLWSHRVLCATVGSQNRLS